MIKEGLSYFNENLFLPIILSFISATIFWLFFNYYPERKRYKKIRPKVEFDLFQIHLLLNRLFYTLFKVSPQRGVEDQQEINAGCLTKEVINLWLQDKCLNDSYKYDDKKNQLISIGKDLESIALSYSEKLQEILNFSTYLSVDEILLLQQVEYKLSFFTFQGTAETKTGEIVTVPVVPNLSNRTETFYEIYNLNLTLRKLVLDYKLIAKSSNFNRLPNFELEKVIDCFHRDEFKKCIRTSRKIKDSNINWVLYKCFFKEGKKEKAYEILRNAIKSTHLELVSLRNYLMPVILRDDRIMEICKELRGEVELKYCLKVIQEEITLRNYYELQNLALKKFYETKLKDTLAKGKEEYEIMKRKL